MALQWFTKLKYMSTDSSGIIVGASMVKKEKFDQLSREDQETLLRTAKRAAHALAQVVRKDDAEANQGMIRRGIKATDTEPYRAEWDKAAKETRDRLTGRIYSKSLLAEVEAAAKQPDP